MSGEKAGGEPRIIGFLCEWASDGPDVVTRDMSLTGFPNVKVIRMPCSGMVKPAWLQAAIQGDAKKGIEPADGVLTLGCPMGDCHFNEGNFLCVERIARLSTRLRNRKINPERIGQFYYGATEGAAFLADVRKFVAKIKNLPEPAPAPEKAAKPAAKPATAEGSAGQ